MLAKEHSTVWTVYVDNYGKISSPRRQQISSSRATRAVDDSTRFLILSLPRGNWRKPGSVFKDVLSGWVKDGYRVDGTAYSFLGFTDSHVRSGKLIFFREDAKWTLDRLRGCFGDLDEVFKTSGYGKYAARLALSFSSTVPMVNIPDDHALLLDDLRANDGSLHSDGCGLIRESLAVQLCRQINIPYDTSAFQIRRGGIKGLLVRYPDETFDQLCSHYHGRANGRGSTSKYSIAYRRSMVKYKGGPITLELNNYSTCPGSARLNVGFILLLLTLGIPYTVFEKLLKDQLDLIDSIVHDREMALRYIKGELNAGDTATFNQDLYAMLLACHDLKEPYVEWKLRSFQKQQYDHLSNKLNLRVEDSCYVYGVIDELGILDPDEVYVNLPGRTGVLERDVLVGRNPSYSPSDLRKFRAVNPEALKHLKNCIVFSRLAEHSVADTMASGDLDGDEYFVTWDPNLIPTKTLPSLKRIPASIVTRTQNQQHRPEFARAAVDTFMEHRFSTLLGSMANAWNKAAQATPELANARFATELVPLVELALDSMKSGYNMSLLEAQFNAVKRRYERNEREREPFRSPIDALRDIIPAPPKVVMTSYECDEALLLRDSPEDRASLKQHLSEAPAIMQAFNLDLTRAITEDNGSPDSFTEKMKRSEIRQADLVKQEYRDRYFGGGSFSDMHKQRLRASAWYYYGYSRKKMAFAWLGERYLNEIRARELMIACINLTLIVCRAHRSYKWREASDIHWGYSSSDLLSVVECSDGPDVECGPIAAIAGYHIERHVG
ncbi:RdRP-domain-containing protein [Laetiporus sulphureus 93-53]|uniref:RNA-dependent RNA polymerase n=1 Tax=Laetiporus sulphureus 93-53 TaxID=1314785 RepID=A0A165ILY0_9APHY|nr:RdRP-domain-containing protein [Laetiporus sulphureus 93-53]KZT13262.1 RdRP-domain-containing protein [Laetiporus sulphureus 93-53]